MKRSKGAAECTFPRLSQLHVGKKKILARPSVVFILPVCVFCFFWEWNNFDPWIWTALFYLIQSLPNVSRYQWRLRSLKWNIMSERDFHPFHLKRFWNHFFRNKEVVKEAPGTDLSHLTATVSLFGEKFEPLQITSLPSYLSVIWPLLLTLRTCPCQSH